MWKVDPALEERVSSGEQTSAQGLAVAPLSRSSSGSGSAPNSNTQTIAESHVSEVAGVEAGVEDSQMWLSSEEMRGASPISEFLSE